MNNQLPTTGLPNPLRQNHDAPLAFPWLNQSHHAGNPHAPDPEKTSWQLPGRGIISKFSR